MNCITRFFTLIACTGIFVARVDATAPKPPLTTGLSMGEVLTQWGEPTEKVEHETARSTVWIYPEGKVIFQQGQLAVFPSLTKPSPGQPASDAPLQAVNKHVAPPAPATPYPASRRMPEAQKQDIMRDVLSQLPPDDDTHGGANSSQALGGGGMPKPFGGHRPGSEHLAP